MDLVHELLGRRGLGIILRTSYHGVQSPNCRDLPHNIR